jgi:hypothetical protein
MFWIFRTSEPRKKSGGRNRVQINAGGVQVLRTVTILEPQGFTTFMLDHWSNLKRVSFWGESGPDQTRAHPDAAVLLVPSDEHALRRRHLSTSHSWNDPHSPPQTQTA